MFASEGYGQRIQVRAPSDDRSRIRLIRHQAGRQDREAADLGHCGLGVFPLDHPHLLPRRQLRLPVLRHYPAGDLQQRAGLAEGDKAARDAGRSRVPDWQPGRPGRVARGGEGGRGRVLQEKQNRQVF